MIYILSENEKTNEDSDHSIFQNIVRYEPYISSSWKKGGLTRGSESAALKKGRLSRGGVPTAGGKGKPSRDGAPTA